MGREEAVSHKDAPREGAVQVSLSDMARLEFSDICIYSSYIREQVKLLEQYSRCDVDLWRLLLTHLANGGHLQLIDFHCASFGAEHGERPYLPHSKLAQRLFKLSLKHG